jgi:membrane protease YdiL (CAAX protease family)
VSADTEPMEGPMALPFRERLAKSVRGFGLLGWISFLVITAGAMVVVPLGALLVVLWAWLSRTPWREIGYLRPRSWAAGLALGAAAGAAFKLAMKAVVMPLLGADPVNHAYHYMAGNRGAVAAFAVYAVLGAGWGEETFFRGYLFERLGKLLGASPAAKGTIVVVTAAIFGFLHYAQGWPGVVQALIVGLVFGTVFAVTGRLYTLMVIHAAFDLTAAAMIYLDAESRIAHLLFS